MSTRRFFLKSTGIALFGAGAAPEWLGRAVAGESPRRKILVSIFQRGAVDVLNVAVPHSDRNYYAIRPGIAIPRDRILDLDGTFGLHPAMQPLKNVWDAGQLSLIVATGSPDPTRSHFDAQDYMESGTPGRKSTRDGWLNRSLSKSAAKTTPVRAVSMGSSVARCMRGSIPAVAIANVGNFQVRDKAAAPEFESMYATAFDRNMSTAGRDTFEAVRLMEFLGRQPYTPSAGVEYPSSRFGRSLKEIAQLIKADVGLEVAFTDIGGWDHHVNEVGANVEQGPLANLLRDFASTLAAFHRDLGDRIADVVLVSMSEFGRTARENGNRGTDHGHGSAMWVMGGTVNGGKVLGQWPGLAPEQLYEGRDLAVTTDFRTVLSELVTGHLGNRDVASVFPGYLAAPPRGVLRNTSPV
jgi:uncharacterized protein (DUF1501 family)